MNHLARNLIVLASIIVLQVTIAVLVVPTPASAALLSPPVAEWMRAAGAPKARLGLEVRAVDDGSLLASVGAKQDLNPASVIKLLTGWAALGVIGPTYRWRTGFYLTGPLSNGVLNGDLLIVGGGDPKLVVEDLMELIAQLRAQGLEHIRGNLLLDDSLFEVGRGRATSFDGLVSEPYNVQPNAVMMNFKSTKFTLSPARSSVAVTLDPPLAGVRIDNRLRLVRGKCRHRARDISVISAGSETQPVIRLDGRYSAGCGQQWSFHAVLNHRQFIDAFFRAGWVAAGGRFDGSARFATGRLAQLTARSKRPPQPWFEWVSPRTLADVIADINKFSNNVMSRQLVLQLAATSGATRPDQAAGLEALRGFLSLQGVQVPGLVIENGSGLSRRTRISAAALTRILLTIARSPWALTIRESLPVAGVDGTMRWRLNQSSVAGQAWIKTGSLDGVRSIAGFVAGRSGRLFAVTMIVNGPRARRAHSAQDALIQWIHDNG